MTLMFHQSGGYARRGNRTIESAKQHANERLGKISTAMSMIPKDGLPSYEDVDAVCHITSLHR